MFLITEIRKVVYSVMCIAAFVLSAQYVNAKVTLPSVFSDYMVLQQKTKAAVWGKAEPGKTITISTTWSRARYSSKADEQGNWKMMVTTPSYGGPYAVTISDGEPLMLMNVLIGEVWVCSGQSNMEMPLAGWGKIDNYQQEIDNAKYPSIRLLQVHQATSNLPVDDAKVANGGWKPCIPQFVPEFSSVAYFFARELYQKTKIPIGLIHTSWGGTIAEAWTSGTTLKTMADFAMATTKIEEEGRSMTELGEAQAMLAWQKVVQEKDAGYKAGNPVWLGNDLDESSWKAMQLPGEWENSVLPNFDGVVYFRRKITIPKSLEGKELKLRLGMIDDNDITYFDGAKLGETQGYNVERSYTIPASLAIAGVHTITVRVFDGGGGGGIYGEKEKLNLTTSDGERIALDGVWRYKVAVDLKDLPPSPALRKSPNRPTVLYNAMINPFTSYAIRGAIWYQGESNADRANQYRELFPAMISDWRKKWRQGDFPFYYVQLANFMQAKPEPASSAWAELRDAQFQTLKLPNTGMAVAIDIGDAADIHPKNKQEVGRRLALIALAKTYGKKVVHSGPVLNAQQVVGSTVQLRFNFAEGGLESKGGELTGFAIAGPDQKFYWAKAVIKDNEIYLSSPDVPNPVAVRYAWADNPKSNLYNKAGLPASPFRTDNWEDTTTLKK